MSNQKNDYGWVGWVVALIIGIIFIFSTINTNSDKKSISDPIEPATPTSQPTAGAALESEPVQDGASWHCVDATSYNQNAYDDNKCTKGDETKFVSDSQAIELDPSYSPGKAGATYYNNR